jgi:hypothetical protein
MQDRKRYRSRMDPPPRQPTSAALTGWVKERTLATPLPEDVRLPAAYDDRDIAALKSLRYGSEQHQRALEWIVWASGTYHNAFRLDPIAAAYAAGRRSVGLEIVKLINSKTPTQDDSEHG